MMMVIYLLLVIINLTILKCASAEDHKVINDISSKTPSTFDIFSRHLDEQLLHRVLQYDAKSTGRMVMASKDLQKLATGSRTFRFFEGAGWDMPELANFWEFTRNRPQLKVEMSRIMALSHIKDENVFIKTLEALLMNYKVFKELSGPVLKYLIRRNVGTEKQTYILSAFGNRLYDVFFELVKDPSVWNGKYHAHVIKGQINDSFYFDCYNNYVYNSPSALKYIRSKIVGTDETEFNDHLRIQSIAPGGIKLTQCELHAWIAVLIYRRVPEEKYAPCLSTLPKIFLAIIKEYIYKYSPITFNNDEKEYFHGFIVKILDKYLGENANLENEENEVMFLKLLNDVRFGNLNESFYYDRILPFDIKKFRQQLEMLIMAASKANNKLLVKQLARHPDLPINSLFSMVELESPNSFKVYFDMIESESLQNVNGNIKYANSHLIGAIKRSKFKIIKAVASNLGDCFEIQSPIEYLELGFASKYEILIKKREFTQPQYFFIEKMLNDAAETGPNEFIKLITENCGEHSIEPVFIGYKKINVSYEVIQIVLEYQELIGILAKRKIILKCSDKRIDPDEITKFRHVIELTE